MLIDVLSNFHRKTMRVCCSILLNKSPINNRHSLLMLSKLCNSAALLTRGRSGILSASQASIVLQNHFSSFLNQTHFRSSIDSESLCLECPYLSQNRQPLFYSLRLEHTMASASKGEPKSVHDFVVKDAHGNEVDLSQYKGKVLLIVNVASQCGLTNSNYTELTTLYEKYKKQGIEILAFPCNQFGGQEPGTNDQIVEFACTRFKAEFPIFDKVDVNGSSAAPIYKYLKSSKGGLFGDDIKWNFTKFLVDKDGNIVDRYAPTTSPHSIEKDIKQLLGIS